MQANTNMRTIFQQIEMHAFSTPEKPAIMLPDRIITYRMLVDGVASVQRMLATLSLDRQKPVGIVIDNPARHIIFILALIRGGVTSASLRPDQINEAMKNGVTELFVDAPTPMTPGLRTHFVDDSWFMRTNGERLQHDVVHDRIVRLVLTSGSTGQPKLIGWSYGVFHRWIRDSYFTRIGSHERVLCTLGMSSAPMFVFRVLSAGNTICFSPLEDAVRMITLYGITEARGSVAHFRVMMDVASQSGAEVRLAQIAPGGAALSADMADELQRRFKCDILNSYSSTEICYMALARGEILRMRRERGNCFTPFAEFEVVDDSGAPLARGQEGRIRARSDAMGWPYAGDLVETDAVKGDGWFYPGDIGRIDPDGLLIVTGRADEVINCGGAKFTPEIIEENIRRHPRLAGAAVVRMPDREPWLAVTSPAAMTVDEVNQWIARNLRGEMAGVQIARIVLVNEIPQARGKIARAELRRLLQASV